QSPQPEHHAVPIQYDICAVPENPNTYTLQAGLVHGVVTGAEFTLYTDKSLTLDVGSVFCQCTGLLTAHCTGSPRLPEKPQTMYAVEKSDKQEHRLRIFIDQRDPFYPTLKGLLNDWRDDATIRTVLLVSSNSADADLAISSTRDGLVRFGITEETSRQHGLTRMPFYNVRTRDSEQLISILRAASDFYKHLDTPNLGVAVPQQITIECFKVTPPFLRSSWIPEPEGQNLNVEGTIYIDLNERARDAYGYRINNASSTPLYAAVLYFDMSNLAIVPYCIPTMKTRFHSLPPPEDESWAAAVSLPANGALTIGFGDAVSPARTYAVLEDQEVDVGFLR
ncbi:hypothetical protein H0H93_013856, partial [Arthromyces matolae]